MKIIDDGGPAFSKPANPGTYDSGFDGMSLRDWFAGQVVCGDIASTSTVESAGAIAKESLDSGLSIAQVIARNAYVIADALITERSKKS